MANNKTYNGENVVKYGIRRKVINKRIQTYIFLYHELIYDATWHALFRSFVKMTRFTKVTT